MSENPLLRTVSTAFNGRTESGRFGPGNQAAAGRTSRAAELRRAFSESITADDIKELAAAILKAAKGGDIAAAKIILDRCCGKPQPDDAGADAASTNRILSMLENRTNAKA
jgi:N-acetylglucosamine kinase-like BadF-type ATPase